MSVSGVNNAIISSNASFLHFSKHKLLNYTCSQNGGEIKIIHSNTFSPTPGVYTFHSNCTVAGDINTTNNNIQQEIVVLDTTQNSINLCYAQNLIGATLPGINWSGGNGGIGLGMAKGLASCGSDIAIWGRNNEKNEC